MGQMGRPGLSAAQKAELWRRWKQGQSLSEIGLAPGKHAGSIHGVLASNGGFIPFYAQAITPRLDAGGTGGNFAGTGDGVFHPADRRQARSRTLHYQP